LSNKPNLTGRFNDLPICYYRSRGNCDLIIPSAIDMVMSGNVKLIRQVGRVGSMVSISLFSD